MDYDVVDIAVDHLPGALTVMRMLGAGFLF
jgi:hypothetical protein